MFIFATILFELINVKKNNKLAFLSILTSAVILTSSVPVDTTTNSYVSSYYDVLLDDITSEYELVTDNVNFVPKDNYVPQGLALSKEYLFTSSFDYYKDKNSIITVYDYDGNFINQCLLDHDSHVGGIAYDKDNELLWVTTSYGCVSAYSIKDVISKKEVKPVYKDIDVGSNLPNYIYPWHNSVSFLTIYENELYVGNFSLRNDGVVKRYSLDKDGAKLTLKYKNSFKVPNMVQGVTFYKKEDKTYILFSRSYGRNTSSILQIFKYDEDVANYRDDDLVSVSIKMSPMLEQIAIKDASLYVLFESNAKPYTFVQDTDFDSVPVIDTGDLIKKLELKIDTN